MLIHSRTRCSNVRERGRRRVHGFEAAIVATQRALVLFVAIATAAPAIAVEDTDEVSPVEEVAVEAPESPPPIPETTPETHAEAPVASDLEDPAADGAETTPNPADENDPSSAPMADSDDFDMVLIEDGDEAIMFQEIPSVYGVSRFEQKITEAPSFVTLITSEDIQKYGYQTLAEALQGVTGFFVTYDRNYNYLGVRGFNNPGDFNTRVLVLVDGHRMNDNLYDQGGVGTEAVVDVDLIDRIEVIRGPSSSLYGTNAFLGVINVITKRGRDIRGFEASTELGSYDTYRVRGTYGDKFANGVEVLFSGSYYDSQGRETLFYDEFDDPATNSGFTRNADEDRFPHFFGKASLRDLTLQGGYNSRDKGIPTAAYETVFPTKRTQSTDEHAYFFAKYERRFDSKLDVYGRVYYDRFYYQGDYLFEAETPPPDVILNRDKSTGEWWGFEIKLDKQVFDSHNITGGIEYRDNFRQDLKNLDVRPREVLLNEKRDSKNVAVFLQDEFSIVEDLILNAGVRYDYYDSWGSTVNPRIALIYNLDKTTLKALYGTAFRAPNAYERYYEGTGFRPNDDLDPEEITTYELVLEHSLTDYVRGTVAGYFYRINDLIIQEPVGDDVQFRNKGRTQAMGLEFQLETDERGPLGISGRAGYALQSAEDRRTKKRLTNSPAHLLNIDLSKAIYDNKLFASSEFAYTSKRKTLGGDKTNDFAIVHLTLLCKNVYQGLEVSTSVRNVFDTRYSDPGSGEGVHAQDEIEQNGRSFWLKVKYGF